MRAFCLREVIQKLADAGVLCTSCGPFIESTSFDFYGTCLFSNRVEPERTQQPHRGALHKSPYVLATNHRYVITKFLLIELDQTTPVFQLFLTHTVEHRGGPTKILAQSLKEICINPFVLFFERNGQCENLAL